MNRNSHNVKQFIENKENEELHSTHYMELELYEHIRNGNPKKLADFLKSTPLNLNEKKLAKSPLRQAKNIFISTVTNVGMIGAIPGGVDVVAPVARENRPVARAPRGCNAIERVAAILHTCEDVVDRGDAPADGEGDVDACGDARHQSGEGAATFGRGADVEVDQLVGTFVAITQGEILDRAHVDVVAEAHALDHTTVAHVQAGNDAAAQHGAACGNTSARAKRASSRARPSTMPAQPAMREASTSVASCTPPEACTAKAGHAAVMRR